MSQPTPPPQPQPAPQPTSPPWPDPPIVQPRNPHYCCELAQYGDECFCADDFAEVLCAFSGPVIYQELGKWGSDR